MTMENKEIKTMLETEIKKTLNNIEMYTELSKPVAPDVAIGRVSRMDHINNKSVTEAALRQAEKKLKGLEHNLSRVGQPDFAKCGMCRDDIPLGRILIKPESRLCIRCAQRA